MQELEADSLVESWTKNHGIRIPYLDSKAKKREYRPDFLVKKTGGEIELHETKGTHLFDHPDTQAKFDAAERWCEERGIEFVKVTK